MRQVNLFVAAALLVACVFAAEPKTLWSQNLAWGTAQGLALSPKLSHAVYGADETFGYFSVATGQFLWNESYTNINAELEGPYAFADANTLGGVAPDEGTTATLWGVDVRNGNITWTASDDASLDQQIFSGIDGAFYAGCITSEYLTRVSNKGHVDWKVNLNDFVFNIIATHKRVLCAYGNAGTSYVPLTGDVEWTFTGLPTQTQGMGYDDSTGTALFLGAADPDGNQLTYTTLYAIDVNGGKMKWTKNLTVTAGSQVVAAANAFLLCNASYVWAIDATTGDDLWAGPAATTATSTFPAVAGYGDSFYVSVAGHDLTRVHRNGTAMGQWTLGVGQSVSFSPIVSPTTIVVPASDVETGASWLYGIALF